MLPGAASGESLRTMSAFNSPLAAVFQRMQGEATIAKWDYPHEKAAIRRLNASYEVETTFQECA
jgi:hypothetical protein